MKKYIRKAYYMYLNAMNHIIWNCNNIWFFANRKKQENVGKLKNKYKGMSCFIVGNGPSLNAEDLTTIKELGAISFASNRIFDIFPMTPWRPTYYCVSDDSYSRDRNILSEAEKMGSEIFFGKSQAAFFQRNLTCPHIPLYCEISRKDLDNPKFSMDINDRVYDIATVTYFAMQIAVYMGFEKIYLIGVDHKYRFTRDREGNVIENTDVVSYFSSGKSAKTDKAVGASWEMEVAYKCAEETSKHSNFKIYNATRGGYLEIFERADLDKVFAEMRRVKCS